MKFVLGPWIWNAVAGEIPHWGPPDASDGCLDVRSIPDQSVAGGSPKGFAIFSLPDGAPDPGSDYRLLGTTLDATVSPGDRTLIGSQLGVGSLISPTLDVLMYELLTVKGDPTGDTFARPIMPTMQRLMGVMLAGQVVHSERFNHEAIHHAPALTQTQEQYRENKALVAAGKMPPDHHRRILDFTQKKLGIPWEALIPPDMIGEPGPLPHKTEWTESFNQGDSSTLGPDLSWTEPAGDWETKSNVAVVVADNNFSTARADADVSSADHYGEVNVTAIGSGSEDINAGPAARFSPSADTCYFVLANRNNDKVHIYKNIAGVLTPLGEQAITLAIPELYRMSCDGSDLKAYQAGVERVSLSDSSIAGNTRGGIVGYSNVVNEPAVDLFKVADLAAPSGNPWYHYQQQQLLAGAM